MSRLTCPLQPVECSSNNASRTTTGWKSGRFWREFNRNSSFALRGWPVLLLPGSGADDIAGQSQPFEESDHGVRHVVFPPPVAVGGGPLIGVVVVVPTL